VTLLLPQVPLTDAEKAERAAAAANRPSKLALGTEGGFALDHQKDYILDKSASLVVLQGPGQPRLEVPLPCPDLPELVINVITGIQVRQLVWRGGRCGWQLVWKGGGVVVLQGKGQPWLEVPLPCPGLLGLMLNIITCIQV
jgi:hypothetical protein